MPSPEAQRHAEGQRAYTAALTEKLQASAPLLTEKIASALASGGDLNLVATEWSALAKLVGARDLRQSIRMSCRGFYAGFGPSSG